MHELQCVRGDDPAALAIDALDALDLGVLVFARSADRVLLVNESARRLIGDAGTEVLHPTIRDAIASAVTGAVRLALPGGRRLFVRTRPLGDNWLVTLHGEVMREDALFDVLRKRFGLSRRECQVVALVRVGRSNELVGRELGVSAGTVKQYLNGVFKACDVHSRGELVALIERIAREQAGT